jgi:hypothetical protein
VTARALGLALLVAVCGCKPPSVEYFRAQPSVVCRGRATQLSWSASAPSVVVDKETGETVGATAPSGSVTVTPQRPKTTYELRATNFMQTIAHDLDVETITDASPRKIGASVAMPNASCAGDTLTVVANPPADQWDAIIAVADVVAQPERALHVEHLGRSADLAAGASSDAFSGVALVGAWTLSTRLKSGEACGVSAPRNLAVTVSRTCAQ